MKTYTIQSAATAVIVLALVLGVLGTSPSTPNGESHFNTSEIESRIDSGRDKWAWLLKAPVRLASEN